MYNASGETQYLIRPNTCCCGCCVECVCCGKGDAKCMYVPFYIRDPKTKKALPSNVGNNQAQISKVWSGMKKECCSDADNFQVIFPKDTDVITKANLLGSNVLIDFTFFETNQ